MGGAAVRGAMIAFVGVNACQWTVPAPTVPASDGSTIMTDVGADHFATIDTPLPDLDSATDLGQRRPMLNGCQPSFSVSNGIIYPNTAADALNIQGRFNTTNDARCVVTGGVDEAAICALVGTSFRLATGQTLRMAGSRMAAIVTEGDILIEGTLDVSGHDDDGEPGPGVNRAATGSGGGGGGNVDPGASGSGGSFSNPGMNFTTALRSGGGSDDFSGGGAIQLVSLCGAVRVTGTILARGGAGWRSDRGGGAGGTVWIQASTIDFRPGSRVALSGGGGAGGSCCASCTCSSTWVSGQGGMGTTPGAGGQCASGTVTGGAGGRGGSEQMAPTRGAPGSTETNSIECRNPARQTATGRGGGGGSRGRLVIQAPMNSCATVSTDGECTFRPL